ncbi:MAG: hypothetical protein Kow0089_12780 [Desulfobulbaceae bacterium]
MKKLSAVLVTIALFMLGGCGSKEPDSTVFIREGLDLNYVERVAVLPFDNLTIDEYAGKRVRDMAFTETLASGKFDVVEQGVVDAVLREMALSADSPLDAPVLKILGKRLGVNAFISGTVNSIRGGGSGYQYPEVSLSLYLIDSETAEVLWRSTAYKNGYSVWNRLFDLDPQDEFEITMLLLQEMLGTIQK